MPGGRFYFIEHIAGTPWTLPHFLQHFLSKSLILGPPCSADVAVTRATLCPIEQGGFKMVAGGEEIDKLGPQKCFLGARQMLYSVWTAKNPNVCREYHPCWLCRKEHFAEEKKLFVVTFLVFIMR
ncbi:Methyltransferase-like protein [Desmophyllum pertusum]|uniref:Methyltransferase-like protein n=1 Tax=Desmophyllum pertusum TaxID=174260 RepID=A0A9W9YCY6_9CNID|nr:Methyltransferase-like protein [Desmophyllum pertusum]